VNLCLYTISNKLARYKNFISSVQSTHISSQLSSASSNNSNNVSMEFQELYLRYYVADFSPLHTNGIMEIRGRNNQL
jgi:Fe(3+) dicitrate transport protein